MAAAGLEMGVAHLVGFSKASRRIRVQRGRPRGQSCEGSANIVLCDSQVRARVPSCLKPQCAVGVLEECMNQPEQSTVLYKNSPEPGDPENLCYPGVPELLFASALQSP